jgi:preprotein translocase subunit YajC
MLLPREIVGSLLARGSLLAQSEATVPEVSPTLPVERTPLQEFLGSPFLLLGGLMALFYFVVMLPERRRKAEESTRQSAIKKNDRIVTTGGIHGVVCAAGDAETITIRLDESGTARMKIDRRAVARVLTDSSETSETKE